MFSKMLNIGVSLFACASLTTAISANLLANPDIEGDYALWGPWANSFAEADPLDENNTAMKMFGNWSGSFNVSGAFQQFAAVEGQTFEMSAKTLHVTGDEMTADGTEDNWVVMKLTFFDAADAEISFVEENILDGNSPLDAWIDNAPMQATAPAGTAKVGAYIMYLQPMWDGGAAWIDDVVLTEVIPEPTSLALLSILSLGALHRKRKTS
ncbi:PEP-CTERM sorting domain-containing protein [Planctomycetota bacterium]|nr:PEP-CTERM sorting domain-containing protein [Planctomycetota bacterium]